MPELPEVETIKRILGPQLQGLAITKVTVNRSEVVAHPTAEEFCRQLTGQTISAVIRKGKFLTLLLENKNRMILHLRMTGCLLITSSDFPQEKHTHVIFSLSNGKELRFSDTRRFGRFWLLTKDETDTYSGIEKLGIEPFSSDLSAEYLYSHLGKRRRAIKDCLLEQHIIAGIGNIYSDEILFAAKIYPACPASQLQPNDWERLAVAIPERLLYFIEKNEVTPEEYLKTRGQNYRNTPFLQVYGREGENCPICGSTLRRIVVSGRSSVYCPACQRDTGF